MMEDAPSVAEGRAVPGGRVSDSRAQHHHREPDPCSDPVADTRQLRARVAAFSACVCFFPTSDQYFIILENFRVKASRTCVLGTYSGNSGGRNLSPSPRCFNSFPQQGKFGSDTHCHSIAKVRR